MYVSSVSSKRIGKLGLTPEQLFQDTLALKREFVEHAYPPYRLSSITRTKPSTRHLTLSCTKRKWLTQRSKKPFWPKPNDLPTPLPGSKRKCDGPKSVIRKRVSGSYWRSKMTFSQTEVLQERSENFLTFYLNDHQFLQKMLSAFRPIRLPNAALPGIIVSQVAPTYFMTKAELRQKFLAKRKALTTEEVTRDSQRIASNFFAYLEQHDLADTRALSCIRFCPLNDVMK